MVWLIFDKNLQPFYCLKSHATRYEFQKLSLCPRTIWFLTTARCNWSTGSADLFCLFNLLQNWQLNGLQILSWHLPKIPFFFVLGTCKFLELISIQMSSNNPFSLHILTYNQQPYQICTVIRSIFTLFLRWSAGFSSSWSGDGNRSPWHCAVKRSATADRWVRYISGIIRITVIQGVTFILSTGTAGLSHKNPAFVGKFYDRFFA